MRLRGRVAVVTGGARGIGRAIAERFVEEGAAVVLADRDAETAGRQMLDQGNGKIVNISSIAASLGFARSIAYSAAKGGVDALTRVMAVELARDNVQVNVIAPGPIETELMLSAVSEAGLAERRAGVPVGRLGQPADVAEAAVLASEESNWVTGTVLRVDGGYAARRHGGEDGSVTAASGATPR